MGNLIQALKMIMEGLEDVDHAIEFCKEQNDEELWENLITYSMGRPSEWHLSDWWNQRVKTQTICFTFSDATLTG